MDTGLAVSGNTAVALTTPRAEVTQADAHSGSTLLPINKGLAITKAVGIRATGSVTVGNKGMLFTSATRIVFAALPKGSIFVSNIKDIGVSQGTSFALNSNAILHTTIGRNTKALIVNRCVRSCNPTNVSSFTTLVGDGRSDSV